MKKNLFLSLVAALLLSATAFADNGVSEKVLNSFKATFPAAQEVSWQEFADNYVVTFVQHAVRERISYDKEGNFLNATRYYGEEHLPVNILCKLKKRFPNQHVFGVTEVDTDASVDYYVKLEDSNNWITVKSDNAGTMEIVEKFKKAEEK